MQYVYKIQTEMEQRWWKYKRYELDGTGPSVTSSTTLSKKKFNKNYIWHVKRDTWYLPRDTWHMTCDTWGGIEHYLKMSASQLLRFGIGSVLKILN